MILSRPFIQFLGVRLQKAFIKPILHNDMKKICLICQGEFISKHFRKAMCSQECVKERNKQKANQWCADNPDKVLKMNRATQKRRVENGKVREYLIARRSSKAGYIDRFLERAKKINPGTDLTRSYLESIFADKCAVTGVSFNYDRRNGTSFQNPFTPSIDRIDSALSYQQGNIQIVLSAVNFAKSEFTMKDFISVWQQITASWSALKHSKH